MSKQACNPTPVGWGSPQRMIIRRLGFTPAQISKNLSFKRWDKSQHTKNASIQSIVGILLFGTLLASTSYAQTCKDSITKTAPDSRYEILGNGNEVKDKQTGLIWQRCSLGQAWDATANNGNGSCSGTASTHNWPEALTQALSLGNGYRLPNIKELQSLVEEACYSPAINNKIFPNTNTNTSYWSASPFANDGYNAWRVLFYDGHAHGRLKYNSYYVRAVRESR